VYLKLYLELDEDERVGITSLRRILFKRGYLVDINDNNLGDIVSKRHAESELLESSSTGVVFH
jgi:hypothetical protein